MKSNSVGVSDSPSNVRLAKPDSAVRLTFSYEGNKIDLISKQKIKKRLPVPPRLGIQKEQTPGFWLELSNDNKRLLYRQIMDNPIRIDTEVFSENPNESITRHELADPKGTFSMVIPDIPDARNLDLFGSPILSEGMRGLQKPATKIFHIDLKEDEKDESK
jgi:hypothetical protein